MANHDELVEFVRVALACGHSRDEIAEALRAAGWSSSQSKRALAAFAPIDFAVPVPRPQASLSARETFLYLVLFTTLYLVIWNLGSMLFDFVDHAFPDPLGRTNETYLFDSLRSSIAMMIVALPAFLYVTRITTVAVEDDPTLRLSPVRRWLTYMTLFFAVCGLLSAAFMLVYATLGGGLTLRFVSKALIVASLAGGIFRYYLSDLRIDEHQAEAS